MIERHRQKGITGIGMIIILALIAFFALAILRLFPMYIEYFKVTSIMNSIAEESQNGSLSNDDVMKTLMRRFEVDDVDNVKTEDVFITAEDKQRRLEVDYEVRSAFLGNVSIVGHFNKQVDLK